MLLTSTGSMSAVTVGDVTSSADIDAQSMNNYDDYTGMMYDLIFSHPRGISPVTSYQYKQLLSSKCLTHVMSSVVSSVNMSEVFVSSEERERYEWVMMNFSRSSDHPLAALHVIGMHYNNFTLLRILNHLNIPTPYTAQIMLHRGRELPSILALLLTLVRYSEPVNRCLEYVRTQSVKDILKACSELRSVMYDGDLEKHLLHMSAYSMEKPDKSSFGPDTLVQTAMMYDNLVVAQAILAKFNDIILSSTTMLVGLYKGNAKLLHSGTHRFILTVKELEWVVDYAGLPVLKEIIETRHKWAHTTVISKVLDRGIALGTIDPLKAEALILSSRLPITCKHFTDTCVNGNVNHLRVLLHNATTWSPGLCIAELNRCQCKSPNQKVIYSYIVKYMEKHNIPYFYSHGDKLIVGGSLHISTSTVGSSI